MRCMTAIDLNVPVRTSCHLYDAKYSRLEGLAGGKEQARPAIERALGIVMTLPDGVRATVTINGH